MLKSRTNKSMEIEVSKSWETNWDSDHTRKRSWQSIESSESFNRGTMSLSQHEPSIWLDERQGSALVLGMAISLWPIFPLLYQSRSDAIHQKRDGQSPCRLNKSHRWFFQLEPSRISSCTVCLPEGISTILVIHIDSPIKFALISIKSLLLTMIRH